MRTRTRITIALIGVGGLLVAWYLLSPLFINRVVEEELPTGEEPLAAEQSADSMVDPPAAARATTAMEEAMDEPDKRMEEPMPPGGMAQMRILAQGDFYDLAHEGMGTATVYQLEDGSRVLRFENFQVLNGPDLHVWLVPDDPVPNAVGRELPGYVDLGALKGNIGSQNYELPEGLKLEDFGSVVIWCVPFRVPFNAAPLDAP